LSFEEIILVEGKRFISSKKEKKTLCHRAGLTSNCSSWNYSEVERWGEFPAEQRILIFHCHIPLELNDMNSTVMWISLGRYTVYAKAFSSIL